MTKTSYGMFSDAGNRRVHEARKRAVERIKNLKVSELDRINEIAHEELRKVTEEVDHDNYAEVGDTAVRESFIYRLSKDLKDEGIPSDALSIYH